MKATGLMIGDWVYGLYPNGSRYANPFRISAVDIYPLNRSPRIVTMGGYGFHEEYLEPIPLTPEILEKNGFKWHNGLTFIHPDSKFFVPVPDSRVTVTAFNMNVTFYYVHELQHALRLCGLTDLADNFKV